jgi:DnaJ homologue, subfamily C, member 28, conserved domain
MACICQISGEKMNLDKIVEEAIRRAQERGEFDNLPGKGKPIDLSEYFEMPEEVRVAQTVLKNAGFISPEVELLKEIAQLREVLAGTRDEKKQSEIRKQIQEKQLEFSLRLEKRKK